MAKMGKMFPSKWLAAADLNDSDLTVTINSVTEELVGQGEQAEYKWVCYFQECEKGMVLNKTNAQAIAAIYGDDTDDWLGRPVVLFPTEVDFGGKKVEAIRVKSKATLALAQKARKPQPAQATKGKVQPVTQAEVDESEDIEVPF